MMMNLSATAADRSQLFQLLALGFVHPVVELHETLVDGSYQTRLREVARDGFEIDVALEAVSNTFADYEAHYIRSFQVGSRGKPQINLNAGDYSSLLDGGSRPEFLLDYSAWYRHFGLKTNEDDQSNELPDHLVCQLEFMAWLSHLEASNLKTTGESDSNDSELKRGYQSAQRDFCERHLLPFLELLVDAIEKDKFQKSSLSKQLAKLSLDATACISAELKRQIGPAQKRSENDQSIAAVNLWG